ncbi:MULTISPECIES: glycoside hydrolase family 3 C-terminal domain-containing protein [unclassified Sphingopyxis]
MGVSWAGGIRKDGATALPSAVAMASSWNTGLIELGGRMIGGEARAKGFNVLLAGGMNLVREPRNGRVFEYFGEDPLLAGEMAGASIRGVQSNHVISTMKHFALNAQETARGFIDVRISEAAARESDLLSFQIALEKGRPGAVMCAYNKVNGHYACENDWLLNKVLKQDWGFKGFVMSDWGGVHTMDAAINGLDQQSGFQLDPKLFFGPELAAAAASEPRLAARIKDMNRRVLYGIYSNGLDQNPPVVQPIDFEANGKIAEAVAKEGIVLLHNRANALPLAATAKKIAVIGGYADSGVLSGAGSSQVQSIEGPAVAVPIGGSGPFAGLFSQAYHRSVPLEALKARAPATKFVFRDGRYITDAVEAARGADVAIVFANQWRGEGSDVPDLNLPQGQDQLIEAVAAVNPNTIVVLQTGGAVFMPWLEKTAAVVEAWYPGARGGPAIASVLYGDVNPSGRLPVTFPASAEQLPFPILPGSDWVEPDLMGRQGKERGLSVDYDVDGSDVGYRWYSRKGYKPLFPFGYGLSYTKFAHTGLRLSGKQTVTATFNVKNIGEKSGADVAQLYLVSAAGQKKLRLLGWSKVNLAPGASKTVTVTVDPRLLADWKEGGWQIAGGAYEVALGTSAADLGPVQTVQLASRRWGHPELVGELTAQHEARGREGELAPVAVDMCRKPRVRCARFDRRALGPAA